MRENASSMRAFVAIESGNCWQHSDEDCTNLKIGHIRSFQQLCMVVITSSRRTWEICNKCIYVKIALVVVHKRKLWIGKWVRASCVSESTVYLALYGKTKTKNSRSISEHMVLLSNDGEALQTHPTWVSYFEPFSKHNWIVAVMRSIFNSMEIHSNNGSICSF